MFTTLYSILSQTN